MSTPPKSYLTPEQYLEIDRKAEFKSEYFQGEMFAMAGAPRAHNLIVGNLIRELSQQLRRRPCEAYPSDMRVRISEGSERISAELFTRQPDGRWLLTSVHSLESSLELVSAAAAFCWPMSTKKWTSASRRLSLPRCTASGLRPKS